MVCVGLLRFHFELNKKETGIEKPFFLIITLFIYRVLLFSSWKEMSQMCNPIEKKAALFFLI